MGLFTVRTLGWIARVKPALLHSVNPGMLEKMREELAEQCLLGVQLRRDAANPQPYFVKHNLMAAASFRSVMQTWRETGVVKTVKMVCSSDGPCDACADVKGKTYHLSNVPELPYSLCSNTVIGCRCAAVTAAIG